MKTKLLAMCVLALSQQAFTQNAHDFFRGDVFPPPRDTPAAWLLELHKADALLGANIAVAEFLPNTRLAWHNHPGGQVLLITDGVGYYQEQGGPKRIVRAGDVITCAPGVEHWHGASVETGLTYVAISPAQKGGTVWGQPVSDADYASAAVDRRTPAVFRKAGIVKSAQLVKPDAVFPFQVASVGFAPGGSSKPHSEAGGQILIAIEGTGHYQEKDQPQRVVRKGDLIKAAPAVEHREGASSENGAAYLVITPVNP